MYTYEDYYTNSKRSEIDSYPDWVRSEKYYNCDGALDMLDGEEAPVEKHKSFLRTLSGLRSILQRKPKIA